MVKSCKVINSLWFICLDEIDSADKISKSKPIKEAVDFIYPYAQNYPVIYEACKSLITFAQQGSEPKN